MTVRESMADKIMVIGIDGMDPRLTQKYVKQGIMPNVQKLLEAGSAREDLKMMGNVPTITPPMWTTLATGATPSVHGITCFWRQSKERLDSICYNLDSRNCRAEQVWNVLAEAGYQTLVFNWPGSSWPPTSDNANLHVIDGTSPGSVNTSAGVIDSEQITVADDAIEKLIYRPQAPIETGAGCIMKNLEEETAKEENIKEKAVSSGDVVNFILTHADGEGVLEDIGKDLVNSPFKAPTGWNNVPKGAKEFSLSFCQGLVHRPALLCCDENGKYDRVLIYKNKKDDAPLCVIRDGEPAYDVLDQYVTEQGTVTTNRSFYVLEIKDDGSQVQIFATDAYDITKNDLFHPKSLHKIITENVGYPTAFSSGGGKHLNIIRKTMLPVWKHLGEWQANTLVYLARNNNYQAIFSHYHNIDAYGHTFYKWAKEREHFQGDIEAYHEIMAQGYKDTDDYIGHFLPLLEEGWTLLVVSDHGLVISEEEEPPYLGDPFGINVNIMTELGYTVLKKDADGQMLKEIDWEKTKAVATRGNHIWINLKGRNETGIVALEDKYALEAQIISDLYNYRDPLTKKRVISVALRNKDAAFLGMSGEECGDIIYWLEEGATRVHGDSLPTFEGYFNTSVSPIFIAAGKGIKKGYTCDRVVRQIDVAPTVAALMGVRMPAQAEGAVVHQILEEEF